MEEVRQSLEWLRDLPDGALLGLILFGAFFEYIFPPFPGDLWTIGGAVALAQRESYWALFFGFLAVNVGAAGGFLVDYLFGRWLAEPRRRFRHWGPRWERLGRAIDRIALGFERHTVFYLVVNRFLPGVRALFFVAAGFARVPVWKVLVFGVLSAAVWSGLVLAGGYLVGRNLEKLFSWVETYTWGAWLFLSLVVMVFLIRWLIGKRRAARQSVPERPPETIRPGLP